MFFSTLSLSCLLDHHAKNGFVRTYSFSTSSRVSTSGTPSVSGSSTVRAAEQSALKARGNVSLSLHPFTASFTHNAPMKSIGNASMVTDGR